MSPDDTKSLIDGTIVSGAPGSINATKMRTVFKAVVDAIVAAVASKADLDSAVFTDMVEVPTAAPGTNNNTAASTAFVTNAISDATTGVASFNSRTGAVELLAEDIGDALGYTPANTVNAALGGAPTATTAPDGNSSTRVSTTAFVQNAINLLKSTVGSGLDTLAKIETAIGLLAPRANPTFTGTVTVPTASPGDNTTKAASTAFVTDAITGSVAGVSSFNTRAGAVTLSSGDVTDALGYTPASTASPNLTGNPTAPTQADGNTSTRVANTTFVQNAITLIRGGVASTYDTLHKLATLKADLASPTFTGVPAVPTASPGTSTTQAASTAFAKALADTKVGSVVVNGGSPAPGNYIASVAAIVSAGALTITCTSAPNANNGGGGGGTCFPAGSMVRMADGSDREITDVHAGELVWSPTGPAEVERLHITTLGLRTLWRMVDRSITWSDEHTFVVERCGDRRLWSMDLDRLMSEAERGLIGGIEDWEWMFEGKADRGEQFVTINGLRVNAPVRARNGVKSSLPLYVPITKNGELIAVNGYVVGAGLDGSKCDYRNITWQC